MAGPLHQSGRSSHLAILPLALLAALGPGGCAGGGSGGDDGGGGFFGLFAPPRPDPNDVTTPMTQYERARLLSRVRSDPGQLQNLTLRERYEISKLAAAASNNEAEDEAER